MWDSIAIIAFLFLKFRLRSCGSIIRKLNCMSIIHFVKEFLDEIHKNRQTHAFKAKIPLAVQQGVNLVKNPKATGNKTNAAGEGETSPRLLYRKQEEAQARRRRGHNTKVGRESSPNRPGANTNMNSNPIDPFCSNFPC